MGTLGSPLETIQSTRTEPWSTVLYSTVGNTRISGILECKVKGLLPCEIDGPKKHYKTRPRPLVAGSFVLYFLAVKVRLFLCKKKQKTKHYKTRRFYWLSYQPYLWVERRILSVTIIGRQSHWRRLHGQAWRGLILVEFYSISLYPLHQHGKAITHLGPIACPSYFVHWSHMTRDPKTTFASSAFAWDAMNMVMFCATVKPILDHVQCCTNILKWDLNLCLISKVPVFLRETNWIFSKLLKTWFWPNS